MVYFLILLIAAVFYVSLKGNINALKKRQNLFKPMGMNSYFEGNCFIVKRSKLNIFTELNNICISENIIPLDAKWKEFSFVDGTALLLNAFNFDLCYMDSENMPKEKAEYYTNFITKKFNVSATTCYSNWFQNPFKNNSGLGAIAITNNTSDMAIIFVDNSKIAFTYFISED